MRYIRNMKYNKELSYIGLSMLISVVMLFGSTLTFRNGTMLSTMGTLVMCGLGIAIHPYREYNK